jgi:hypothetical protein
VARRTPERGMGDRCLASSGQAFQHPSGAASAHSMISSARSRSDGGTARPSALAVAPSSGPLPARCSCRPVPPRCSGPREAGDEAKLHRVAAGVKNDRGA